jgi:DNA helicase-2/ATP-dependent DNA helicase PcrA
MLHGQTRFHIASRFFQEIPENLLRRLNRMRVQQRTVPYYTGYGASAPVEEAAVPLAMLEASSPWRIGQSVTHPKFGSGVIVNSEGRGAEARVQVNFRGAGLKWLMLEYANLAPA